MKYNWLNVAFTWQKHARKSEINIINNIEFNFVDVSYYSLHHYFIAKQLHTSDIGNFYSNQYVFLTCRRACQKYLNIS